MASARRRPRPPPDDTTQLSKAMSYLLRHGAEKEGFTLLDGGFLSAEDILSFSSIRSKGFTEADLRRVVETNDKKRFFMEEHNGKLHIRANQGHSVQVDETMMNMMPITKAEDAPVVVHGTYFKAWECIKHQGLSRMNRQHIHFAAGVPGNSEVVSGMRRGCHVIIFIDLAIALQKGLLFYRSANNVILSPGDAQGTIFPEFFKEVWQMNPRKRLQ
ncbi:hypothetical protein CAPTEDRAFT_138742 [Capitella teleta]|uniref:2'-phosphotransferase n=1 Tax=Capitella teleta TaxID=283909 RepID=R7VCQ3_CAPTE|nr:hypothetical protein CAPTEDRAFT_138742 [Capitella teleta]|eukprot:ELU16414.1 hypothetical protein CAPTEDRAFT_138742 [Capitella teleta]